MNQSAEFFLQDMIEKLSLLNDEKLSKHSFLEDICRFFDISHAFVFETDPAGIFHKKVYYEVVKTKPIDDSFNMKELLGLERLSELCSEKIIICSAKAQKNSLKEKLTDIFKLNTLIFIPILNQHFELAGFVGIGDRRSTARHASADISKSCALLSLLANEIKLEMFQKGIANAEEALSNILDHVGIDIYVNDYYTHDVLYANKSMAAPYGGVDNMIGKKCWGTIFTDKTGPCDFCPQPKLLDENGEPNKTHTWDYERPFDKSWFRVLSSSFTWTDGRIAHLVASVDITENKRNQFLIEKLAQYDHLTGLANRRSLHDDIQLFISDSTQFGEKFYVLFCDLDGFKNVNDTLGHHAGDMLLINIANDLKDISTESVKTYRQGGDEFVVLVKDEGDIAFIKDIIKDLFMLFHKRHNFEGKEMGCGCSIGVAHYPTAANTAKEIFHLADTAMYSVKKERRGTVRFCKNGKFVSKDEYFDE